MRRKRTRHPNYTPAVCMGVCALLLVWALGLLLHRCSARALEAVSGLSRRDLDAYLEEEIPLVAWVTLDYESPFRCDGGWYLANGRFYNTYCNLHCVVVLAQGEEGFLTANPLTGWQWVDEDQFWSAFDAMGRRAVVVTK